MFGVSARFNSIFMYILIAIEIWDLLSCNIGYCGYILNNFPRQWLKRQHKCYYHLKFKHTCYAKARNGPSEAVLGADGVK